MGFSKTFTVIVGHEPYLSSLISEIISDANTSSHLVLKKAGLAKIEITSQNAQTMHGELKWLLTPRLIKISPNRETLYDMNEMAKEYATALNRSVKYVDVPYDKWLKEELMPVGLSQYVFDHISTMAKLHAENRYDRLTSDVQNLTGKPSMSVQEYVAAHPLILEI